MNKLWTRPGAALVIGIVLGLVLGFRTHNFGLWLIIGVVLGAAFEAMSYARRRSENADGGEPGPGDGR
jgi:hypothetical protein